ncbi:MAG: plasmid partitioning protein RepB [Proteobacteria bacterium]|nr:plasmid partitioning protein RepB [Pseudomonadota bacterium]
MNKRTDRIRSLFAQQPPPSLSADNKGPEVLRVASGSVKAVKETFSGIERENEELRERLQGQGAVVEVDTALIVPSPVADRFIVDNDASYETLRQSIQAHGQEVPVLLRPHPEEIGRFQISYGHRRVRAARDLGIPVKATIRNLTDEQLVVAQGLENAAREDLSFIERALFALRLEKQGFARSVVQDALTIDRAEASKLVAVANAIPLDVCEVIGKAPKIGRGRWQEFSEALKTEGALQRVRSLMRDPALASRSSDDRFAALLAATQPRMAAPEADVIVALDGDAVATVKSTRRGTTLTFEPGRMSDFGSFLRGQIPQLYEAYKAQKE